MIETPNGIKIIVPTPYLLYTLRAHKLNSFENSMAPREKQLLQETCDVDCILDEVQIVKEKSKLLQKFQDELKEQSRTSLPVMVSMVFLRIPLWITLHMVGNISSDLDDGNADELAASGLAQSLANISGLSIAAGLSAALTTLAGQAHGIDHQRKVSTVNDNQDGEVPQLLLSSSDDSVEGNPQYVLPSFSQSATTYFVRGVFVQFVFAIPIGFYWMIGVKPLLVALGQDENVASLAEVSGTFS